MYARYGRYRDTDTTDTNYQIRQIQSDIEIQIRQVHRHDGYNRYRDTDTIDLVCMPDTAADTEIQIRQIRTNTRLV